MTVGTRVYNDQAISSINRLTGDLQAVQTKISTGKNLIRTSDDPATAALISYAKEQKEMLAGYNKNISRAKSKLAQAESAVDTSINAINRAYELSLQAKNDTNNPADRKIIAMEIRSLKEEVFNLANSRGSDGTYLFAGFKVTKQPFIKDINGVVAGVGDRGVHSISTSDTRRSVTGLDGQDVFMGVRYSTGVESIFDTFDTLISDLEENKIGDSSISKLNEAVGHFNLQQTKIGAVINGLEKQENLNDRRTLLMDQDLSNMEDADLSKLVTELQSKLVSRNAAQQAFVKIAQESLFNYVR